MAIKSTPQRPGVNPLGGSPLTSSVQENFRGFTYSGESMIVSRRPFLGFVSTRLVLREADLDMPLCVSSSQRPPDGILIDDDGEALEEDEDALDPEDYDEDAEDDEEDGTTLVRGVLRRDADIDMED